MADIGMGFEQSFRAVNPAGLSIGHLPAPGTPIEISGPHPEPSRATKGWVEMILRLQEAGADLPDDLIMSGPDYYREGNNKGLLYARRNNKLLAAIATTKYAGAILMDAAYCQGDPTTTSREAVSIYNIEGAQAFHTLLVKGLFARYDGSSPKRTATYLELPFSNLLNMIKPPGDLNGYNSNSLLANFPFLAAISKYAHLAGTRTSVLNEIIADNFRIPLPGRVLEPGRAYSKDDISKLHAAATAKGDFNGVIAYTPLEDQNSLREDFFRNSKLVGSLVMNADGSKVSPVWPNGTSSKNIAAGYPETPTQRRVRFLAQL